MPSTKLYFTNALDLATLAVSSENATYPKENLQDRDRASKTRPGTAGAYTITITCPAPVTMRAVILANHNLYTKAATGIYVQGSTSGGFGSPENLIGTPSVPHAPVAGDEPNWKEVFAADKTYQYWRVGVNGATTDMEIGDLYIAWELDLGRHPGGEWGYDFENQGELKIERSVVNSITWGEPLDVRTLNFVAIPKTALDYMRAAYKSVVRGNWLPWWYQDEYGVLHLGRFNSPIKAGHHMGLLWDASFAFKEEP